MEKRRPYDVVLLTALPGSGKSEARKRMSRLSAEECRRRFGIGPTVDLDDYPYVHLMRRFSEELRKRGHPGVFFSSETSLMTEPLDWGVLVHLLNEDFSHLVTGQQYYIGGGGGVVDYLARRIDIARYAVGAPYAFRTMSMDLFQQVAAAVQAEVVDHYQKLNAKIPHDPAELVGKSIVIEFSRGGPDGSTMPLPAPLGYYYSLGQFSDQILQIARVLYIWVTPEQSRAKNIRRRRPDDTSTGSSADEVFHVVPPEVMLGAYGCDDMGWLVEKARRFGTITVQGADGWYNLPFGRLDNRQDLTTFLQGDPANWDSRKLEAFDNELARATAQFRQ